PVDSVSWEDCQAFLAKLNERLPDGRFRLPTEAEWEYGCRAGTSTRFSHGDDELTLGDYAWHRGNSAGTTHPVGEKRPNVWGLHDMHGNVLEFCDDIYVPCPGEQWNPVAVKEGRLRVVRGGSWYRGAAACCSTARDGMSIEYGDFQYGFRIVFAPGSQDPRQVLAAFGREFCAARVQASLSALQTAVDKGDKFAAEQRLTQVRGLLQQDPRVAVLARRVAALPEPQTTTLDLGKGVAIELVRIPPGKFLPGDPTGLRQQPTHQVTIKRGFYLGKCEVTQEQWQAVMGRRATARVVSPSFTDATRPVDRATAQDCQDFLERLNAHVSVVTLRLPSREEWEYACRAGSTTSYCFGESEGGLAEYAWFTRNAGGRPQPVGRKMANAWGLHDMHGNVAEWCDDGSLRGGTWFDLACNCRSASRRGGNYSGGTGLRVAFMPTGATSAETEPAPVSEPPVVEQPAPPPKMGPLELRAHLPVGVPPRLPGSDDGDKVVFDTGPFHAILQPPDAVARQNQALRFEPDPGNPDAVLVKHRSGSGFGYETLLVCKRQGGQMVWEINKDKAQDYAACLQHLAVVAVTRKNGDEVCLPCMRKREPESRNLVLAYRADGSLASAREEATWTCRYPWPQALYVQHKDMQGGKPLRLTGPHASSGGGVDISSGTDPTGRFTAVTFTGVMRAPGRPLSEVRLVLKFTVGNETNTMEGTAVTAVLSCAGIKEYMEDTKGALPNEGRLPQEVFRGIEGVMLLDPWGIPLAVLTPMLRADLGPGRAIPTTTVPPTELTPPEHKEQPPRVCPGCRGKAVVPCPDCGGKGVARVERKRCGNCDGKGGGRCKECGGKGFGRCPDCGGSGRIWRSSGGRPFRRVDCDRCAATGLGSRCTHCGGDGRAECGECNGKGTVPAPVPCAKCKGDKTVPCPDCGGQGSLPGR
ncbi:MAG: hypothetical protein FJ290_19085, partial [Planctomycetes bacterium]|nr:hypothetical protein [Planctomycetota bacterium]